MRHPDFRAQARVHSRSPCHRSTKVYSPLASPCVLHHTLTTQHVLPNNKHGQMTLLTEKAPAHSCKRTCLIAATPGVHVYMHFNLDLPPSWTEPERRSAQQRENRKHLP